MNYVKRDESEEASQTHKSQQNWEPKKKKESEINLRERWCIIFM